MPHSEFIFYIWCNEDNGNILLSCIWCFIKTNSFIHQFRLWSTATLNLQFSHTFYGFGKLLSFFQRKGAASTLWIYWFVSSKPYVNSFTHSSNRTSESHFLIFLVGYHIAWRSFISIEKMNNGSRIPFNMRISFDVHSPISFQHRSYLVTACSITTNTTSLHIHSVTFASFTQVSSYTLLSGFRLRRTKMSLSFSRNMLSCFILFVLFDFVVLCSCEESLLLFLQ